MKEEREEKAKKRRMLRIAENITVIMWCIMTTVEGTVVAQKYFWAGVPLIIMTGIFLYCHAMSMYYDGACDVWRKIGDILAEVQSEKKEDE